MPYALQQTRKNRRVVITLSAYFYSKENRRNPVLLLAFFGMYVLFKRSHGGLTQVFPRKPKPCIKLPFPPGRIFAPVDIWCIKWTIPPERRRSRFENDHHACSGALCTKLSDDRLRPADFSGSSGPLPLCLPFPRRRSGMHHV